MKSYIYVLLIVIATVFWSCSNVNVNGKVNSENELSETEHSVSSLRNLTSDSENLIGISGDNIGTLESNTILSEELISDNVVELTSETSQTVELMSEIEAYDSYINGEGFCIWNDKNYRIDELLEGDDKRYTYCDIDGDDELELCLDTTREFYVIKLIDNSLMMIHFGAAYDTVFCSNELCGVFYERHGGTPTNIIYQFYTFTTDGRKKEKYAWYDINENNTQDCEDYYLENDGEITMDEWQQAVARFDISLNTVKWTVL